MDPTGVPSQGDYRIPVAGAADNPFINAASTSNQSNSESTKRQTKAKGKTTQDRASVPASASASASVSVSVSASASKAASTDVTPVGDRYQCPKCPKNFSRIENLTRHQANHEDKGKFACLVCKKRFTRSDLLNRHRKIHSQQQEAPKSHVTQVEFSSTPHRSEPRFDLGRSPKREQHEILAAQDDRKSISQDGLNSSSHTPAPPFQQLVSQPAYYPDPSTASQTTYQPIQPASDPSSMQQSAGRTQGLASLVEAALAPQQFTPDENINPKLWDGLMGLGDNPSSYMGSYDADISWTLDSFPTGPLSSYNSDHNMMSTFEDPTDVRSLYPPALQHPPDSHIDDEDEDINDWPDKVSRIESPHRRAPRIVPQLMPVSWQPVLDEARASGLSAATMSPRQEIRDQLRQSLLIALNGNNYRNELSPPEISEVMFPPSEALDFFLRLYIQYIHPRFPVLHLPTFDMCTSPPLFLVAMMFLGSSHSGSDRGRFLRLFYDHLRIACIQMHELDSTFLRSIDNIQTYFLLCLAGTWSGSKQSYEFAEGARGVLVTACRRMRLLDCRPSRLDIDRFLQAGLQVQVSIWLAWIELEKRKRLGLSIYMFDCQYPALFNNQHYVGKAETTNCVFPCDEEVWEAPTADTWKALVGSAETPEPAYYLRALNCCLLRRYIKPAPPIVKTGQFGKILLLYAIHTHIFDWRQAASMLNPTGLMGIEPPYDFGKNSRERRKWLVDALHSWADVYQDRQTSTAALLLHRLGYISLDVSLSDMHLVAGRSNNINDGNFAEQNLKHWANSEIAESTMSHICEMLQLCHQCIKNGTMADSSYEVAFCLFTGGIVCWAYAKLKINAPKEQWMAQVRKASVALGEMGCWRMCLMFGRILNGFQGQIVG